MTALPNFKKIIIANSCTQLSVCLYHMMLVMFSLFSMKYKGSSLLTYEIFGLQVR
jgi:hypothetical protein